MVNKKGIYWEGIFWIFVISVMWFVIFDRVIDNHYVIINRIEEYEQNVIDKIDSLNQIDSIGAYILIGDTVYVIKSGIIEFSTGE